MVYLNVSMPRTNRLTTQNLPTQLLQMATGFRTTQALYVVAKLRIADLIVNGPKACDELAQKTGAHPDSLFRVMRALASLGVFTQDSENRFGLTPLGSLLVTDAPDSIRAAIVFYGQEFYTAAGGLLQTVMTGETAFNRMFGKGHWEYLSEHPDSNEIFNLTMAQSINASPARRSIEKYDFSDRQTVVDVGGGKGTLIASILNKNPHLTGILCDLPAALETAPEYLKSCGLEERVKILAGSAFESIPSGGDVYVMSRVLHDYPDDLALRLLKKCRQVIPPSGVLLIADWVLPEDSSPSQGKLVDLTMLLMTGGRERIESEWKALLNRGGFALKRADVQEALVVAEPFFEPTL